MFSLFKLVTKVVLIIAINKTQVNTVLPIFLPLLVRFTAPIIQGVLGVSDTNNMNGFWTLVISIPDVEGCSHIAANPGSAEDITLGRLAHHYFIVYLHLFP